MLPGFFVASRSVLVLYIRVRPTGIIIAVTVCSPIKEDRNAEMPTKPNAMRHVLFPVNLMMASASRESSPWLTIATASISDPIIKNTASFIKDFATPFGSSIPSITCRNNIISATAGSGTGSKMIRIIAIITMIIVRYAFIGSVMVSPCIDSILEGTGKSNNTAPTANAKSSQRFWVSQKMIC